MNIYILALEPLDTRYTGQWLTELPELFYKVGSLSFTANTNIITLTGDGSSGKTTPGAFLNFADTNIWKNSQMNRVAVKFQENEIQAGDKFIFPDAWHTGIIQLRYMSDLFDIPVEIHSIWHAGSYDTNDFLGRKVKNKTWSFNFERSLFFASDMNYFATRYHANMFIEMVLPDPECISTGESIEIISKIIQTGFPFNYLKDVIKPSNRKKENIILFPHRIAPEKQHDIFLDLQKSLPEYEFITCQNANLSKDQYHELLQRAKIVFSANLQETLGISCYEGMLAGALPLVPDRLSYSEMYTDTFKYPSSWTESWDSYLNNKYKLIILIKLFMESYIDYEAELDMCLRKTSEFFNGDEMIEAMLNC